MTMPLLHRVSLVIPVYRGETTLPTLVREIAILTGEQVTPGGRRYLISEVLLVHDCGPDRSDAVLEALAAQYPFVRPIWLSRNYGQHAATLAGMAGATGDWVATIDEDGQQDPADIAPMLDQAIAGSFQLVYADPVNPPPHGWLRNTFSRTAQDAPASRSLRPNSRPPSRRSCRCSNASHAGPPGSSRACPRHRLSIPGGCSSGRVSRR